MCFGAFASYPYVNSYIMSKLPSQLDKPAGSDISLSTKIKVSLPQSFPVRYLDYYSTSSDVWGECGSQLNPLYECYPHYMLVGSFGQSNTYQLTSGSRYSDLLFSTSEALNTRPSSLKQFFLFQQVDTPLTLKPVRVNLDSMSPESLDRLVGMLTRHGSHGRVRRLFLASYFSLAKEFFFPRVSSAPTYHFLFLTSWLLLRPSGEGPVGTALSSMSSHTDDGSGSLVSRYGHAYGRGELEFMVRHRFFYTFFELLTRHTPIFAMKSRKVDKLRFKHSRGKTGKYSIEWKYIPQYKRLNVVLRWLVDDVRFQKSTTFGGQLSKSLRALLLTPSDHVVVRNRNYVHRHVYARFKTTLLRTLKQVH